MRYNQAVNVMGIAYHYFTIKPKLFEAWAFIFYKGAVKKRPKRNAEVEMASAFLV